MDIRSFMQRNSARSGAAAGLRRGLGTPERKTSVSPKKRSMENQNDKKCKRRIDSPLSSDSDFEDPVPSKLKKTMLKKPLPLVIKKSIDPTLISQKAKMNPISVSDFFNGTKVKAKNSAGPAKESKAKIVRPIKDVEIYSDDDFKEVLLQAEADFLSPAVSTRSKAKTPVKKNTRDPEIETTQPKKLKTPTKSPKSKKISSREIPLLDAEKGQGLLLEDARCLTTPGAAMKKLKSAEKKKTTPKKIETPPPVKLLSRVAKDLNEKPGRFTKVVQKKPQMITVDEMQQSIDCGLFVDRYKPKTIKQIIGQQGDKSCVNKLLNWLRNWNEWHVTKTKEKKRGFGASDDGSCYKCVLLSGPPGIGKTTSAELCCKELGIKFVAKNASDARNKKALESQIMETICSHNVNEYYTDLNKIKSKAASLTVPSHALIMDEVDGMSGNEDRAGVAELINLIKKTKIPIICICNDRQAQKIRTLANYCFDLRFHRPQVSQIKGPMMTVAFKEGIKIEPQKMEQIIEASNHDVRQVMNRLSLLIPEVDDPKIKNSSINGDIALGRKDLTSNIFETIRVIFADDCKEDASKKRTWLDKCELFFSDYNLTPLFTFENYLNVESKSVKKMSEKLGCIATACNLMALGDCVEKQIRTGNNWSLLPDQAIFSVVAPAEHVKGYLKGMAQFPQWFGKYSKQNKIQRMLTQMQMHTCLKMSCNSTSFNLDYAPVLRDKLLKPLISGQDGVEKVMQILVHYDLTKEDMDSILEITQFPISQDSMVKVAPKVKAALTRMYNKKRPMLPFCLKTDAVISKKKKGAATSKEVPPETDDELSNDEAEVEESKEAANAEMMDFE